MKQHVIEKGRQPFIIFESTHWDEEEQADVTEAHELPATYEVCGHCNGTGTSSAHMGSWTADEWTQESHEFREDYLKGLYDKECPVCKGKRVVAVPADKGLTAKQKWALITYQELLQEEAEYESMCRAEQRMGC